MRLDQSLGFGCSSGCVRVTDGIAGREAIFGRTEEVEGADSFGAEGFSDAAEARCDRAELPKLTGSESIDEFLNEDLCALLARGKSKVCDAFPYQNDDRLRDKI